MQAETEDGPREQAAAALAEIGAVELNPRTDPDDGLAAAVLCQAAGAVALPYPVVADLLAIDGARLALVNPAAPRIDHGDLPGEWVAADLDGRRYPAAVGCADKREARAVSGARDVEPGDGSVPAADIDLYLALGAWQILGAMQRCLQIVCEHVNARIQFGKKLSEFQAVRFTVADATVAVRGLDELAKYTMCRWASAAPAVRRADALVLRLKAVDTARAVLRTSHQLLGALGFCDESDISVIDRHTQPLLRLPLSGEELALRLLPGVRDGELETLFSNGRGGAGVSRAGDDAERSDARSGAHEHRTRRCRGGLQPLDEGIPFGAKLRQLAEQRCDETALTVVALDGTEHSLTFGNWTSAPTNGGGRWHQRCRIQVPWSQWRSRTRRSWCWPHWAAGRSARCRSRCNGICPNGSEPGARRRRPRPVVIDEQTWSELDARAGGESESPCPRRFRRWSTGSAAADRPACPR